MLRSLSLAIPPRLAVALLCIIGLCRFPASAEEPCPSQERLQGAWVEQGSGVQLAFEPDRVVLWEKGFLRAARIQRREPCRLIVRDDGMLSTWTVKEEQHALRLDRGKGGTTLERLPQLPSTLDISPFPMPAPMPVPAETAKMVAMDLDARSERDQAALRSTELNREEVLADNVRHLRELVTRYGWIDIPRFGKAGAAAAIMIAKHSGDVRLLQIALPVVERDARENGGGKELVAITVDAVLLTTGHKQKYGSQLTEDAQGKPYVVPVEDLAKVDEYRKELGIAPWADYLAKASQVLYDGVPIRIPGPEE